MVYYSALGTKNKLEVQDRPARGQQLAREDIVEVDQGFPLQGVGLGAQAGYQRVGHPAEEDEHLRPLSGEVEQDQHLQ